LSIIKIEMELFKIRYNLYKYLIKDSFKFKSTFDLLNVFKNLIYIIIIFFILIFIIGYEYINLFIIFFIIILIIFIYNIELILIKLEGIKTNKNFQIYCNYYNTLNKIFNINYDNIDNIENNLLSTSSTSSISKIEMTYGGIDYEYGSNIYYKIVFDTPDNGIQASANIRPLRNGSLDGNIYDLNGGSGYNINNIDIYKLCKNTDGSTTEETSAEFIPTIKAKFKVYINNSNTNSTIKEYSISFRNIYRKIRRNIYYIDNILNEDFEDHINLLKKENDILKYIDIYDKDNEFLKKYLIINKIKNKNIYIIIENINKIKHISDIIYDMKNNTYLIDLELLEKYKDHYKELYLEFIKELDIIDLNFVKKSDIDKIINKTISDFDMIFYYILILIVIILTIIFHIFYIKLY